MFESPRSLSFHSEIEHKHWERRCTNLPKWAAFLHDRGELSRGGLTFPALKFWMLIKFDFSSKIGILVVKFAFATANLKIETLGMCRRFARVFGGITAATGRHYRALHGACYEHSLLQRSPGYYSESGYHWMRGDGRIRFEYGTCGRGKKKLRI